MNTPMQYRGSLARPVSEIVDEACREVELRHDYPEVGGLKTGIEALDRHISEALVPGSLIVLAGESGRGKTAFATQTATAFAHQCPTLVCSLEDTARATVKRALSTISREAVGAIRAGFPGREIPVAFESAAAHLASLPLSYIEGESLTAEEIARQAYLWKRDGGFDHGVLVVDQLSHIAPSSNADREYFRSRDLPMPPPVNAPEHQQLEWRAHMLKLVAQRLGLTVILVHQLNENHGTNEPTLSSIRSSRGVAHKADAVIVCWRPARVEDPFAGPGQPNTVAAPDGHAYLLCIKGREISTFKEEVRWIGSQQRFADLGDAEHSDYKPVEAPSERAREGARKLAELRERFAQRALPTAAIPALPTAEPEAEQ